ncbi:MAG: hypothetical protein HC797_06615 [Anaerolineales bacterium]|nr:hypothetical protein [Anaerolineales bacterium]
MDQNEFVIFAELNPDKFDEILQSLKIIFLTFNLAGKVTIGFGLFFRVKKN